MKILVVGAGAVGGQFGAYLHESGAEVDFLLRPARKEIIDAQGLTLDLPTGKLQVQPHTLIASELKPVYDLIVVSCKAYSLDSVMNDLANAVGEKTVILPLLNGLRHLDLLGEKFGHERVLGGIAKTVATLATPSCIQIKHGPGNITVGARSGRNCTQGVSTLFSVNMSWTTCGTNTASWLLWAPRTVFWAERWANICAAMRVDKLRCSCSRNAPKRRRRPVIPCIRNQLNGFNKRSLAAIRASVHRCTATCVPASRLKATIWWAT